MATLTQKEILEASEEQTSGNFKRRARVRQADRAFQSRQQKRALKDQSLEEVTDAVVVEPVSIEEPVTPVTPVIPKESTMQAQNQTENLAPQQHETQQLPVTADTAKSQWPWPSNGDRPAQDAEADAVEQAPVNEADAQALKLMATSKLLTFKNDSVIDTLKSLPKHLTGQTQDVVKFNDVKVLLDPTASDTLRVSKLPGMFLALRNQLPMGLKLVQEYEFSSITFESLKEEGHITFGVYRPSEPVDDNDARILMVSLSGGHPVNVIGRELERLGGVLSKQDDGTVIVKDLSVNGFVAALGVIYEHRLNYLVLALKDVIVEACTNM